MAHLILYDGVCGLCDRSVRFVLDRDRRDQFRFAPLQGTLARDVLARHGRAASDLDTFYLIENYGQPNERLRSKGRAALRVLRLLGGGWLAALPLGLLPTFLLDALYDSVASHRYRWFGKLDQCRMPQPGEAQKFLEADSR